MMPLFTDGVRTGLVAAVVMTAIPMITFAQTTTPAVESAPAVTKPVVTDSSTTGDQKEETNVPAIESAPAVVEPTASNSGPTAEEDGTGKNTSVQTSPPAKPTLHATIEVEIQRRFNELRRELLDDRADAIDWWLAVIALVLTFFGIVVAIAGLMGFSRFREIENAAKNSVDIAGQHAKDAEHLVKKIEEKLGEAEKGVEAIRRINAEKAADAPEEAKQAVANISENPKASLLDKAIAQAVSLQQQGKRNEAIEKWRAVANIAEGIDNDQAARAYFSIGYLSQDEDPEARILAYDQAIHLKPDFVVAYGNRGNAKGTLGHLEEAIADYSEALRINPQHALTYYNRGHAKGMLGRHEEAIADYNEALRINPQEVRAYNNRGYAKGMLGRHEEAIADYNEALRINPQHAPAYGNRGIAKAELGRHEEALADFDEAIRINPQDAKTYYNRGVAKAELGRHEEALADYDEAIRINPQYALAYGSRGTAKIELDRHEEALADFDEAIRINPQYALAYGSRGIAKGALDRHEEALADFDETIRINPKDALAYYNRGIAYQNIEEFEKARDNLQRALEIAAEEGNQELAQEAQSLLNELPPHEGVD